jgi:hypothetical protein
MPIVLAAITVIIQACFIIHVYKTGRPYWWALIILSFPVIGCVVYYFSEVFPGTQEARKAEKLARAIGKRMDGDKAFMRRVEEVEICGSVDNKLALADECMQRGLYDDAARLYRNCMQGLYAEDPNLLLGLASAQVEQQNFNEARATLDTLHAKHADFKPNDTGLLRARTLEGSGDSAGALQAFETILPVYVGLEARYRYGALLKKLGRTDQAHREWEALIEHARKHRVSHDGELAWLNLAKKEMKG